MRTSSTLKKIVEKINSTHPDKLKLITVRLDDSNTDFGYKFWRFPQLNFHGAQELSQSLSIRYLPSILILNRSGYIVSASGFKDLMEHQDQTIEFWDKLKQH